MKDIFEKSVRLKLRFSTSSGVLSTEDLWDISLKQLDGLYKAMKKQLAEAEEDSLLIKTTPRNTELKLSIALVKHIVETRLIEIDAKTTLIERREKKAKLIAALADKQDEGLKSKTEEELKAMIEEL